MQESSQNQFGKELTVTRITKIKQQKGGGGGVYDSISVWVSFFFQECKWRTFLFLVDM